MDNLSNDTELKEIDNPIEKSSTSKTSMKISKNVIIIILASLLVLSFLGVNIFHNVARGAHSIVVQILTALGFYTGAIINTAADVVGDTAKGSIDIAEGTVHSVGNLLQNEDNINGDTTIQQQWNMSMFNLNPAPKPAPTPAPKPTVVKKKQRV
jgi:hypothetical protein